MSLCEYNGSSTRRHMPLDVKHDVWQKHKSLWLYTCMIFWKSLLTICKGSVCYVIQVIDYTLGRLGFTWCVMDMAMRVSACEMYVISWIAHYYTILLYIYYILYFGLTYQQVWTTPPSTQDTSPPPMSWPSPPECSSPSAAAAARIGACATGLLHACVQLQALDERNSNLLNLRPARGKGSQLFAGKRAQLYIFWLFNYII